MEVVPLGPGFAAEIRGLGLVDVASSAAAYREVRAAFEAHSVLLFRDQTVADDLQAAYSRAFGPLEIVKIGSVGTGTFYSRLNNLRDDGTTQRRHGFVTPSLHNPCAPIRSAIVSGRHSMPRKSTMETLPSDKGARALPARSASSGPESGTGTPCPMTPPCGLPGTPGWPGTCGAGRC